MNAAPVTASLVLGGAILWMLIALPIGILSALKPQVVARSNVDGVRADRDLGAPGVDRADPVATSSASSSAGRRSPATATSSTRRRTAVDRCSGRGTWSCPGSRSRSCSRRLYVRMIRANVMETSSEDYVRTARAKGAPEHVVIRSHILRNALLPIVTMLGMDIGVALGGAIFTETVFSLPGLGQTAFVRRSRTSTCRPCRESSSSRRSRSSSSTSWSTCSTPSSTRESDFPSSDDGKQSNIFPANSSKLPEPVARDKDLVSSQAGLAAAISSRVGTGARRGDGAGSRAVVLGAGVDSLPPRQGRDGERLLHHLPGPGRDLRGAAGGASARPRPERHLLQRCERRPAAGRPVDARADARRRVRPCSSSGRTARSAATSSCACSTAPGSRSRSRCSRRSA